MQQPFQLDVGYKTHPGRARSQNEDAVGVEALDGPSVERLGLLLTVADGMGGHEAGEVASAIAVETAREAYYGGSATDLAERLRQAVAAANQRVYQIAQDSGKIGMGTTFTAAVIYADQVHVAQVGDSRAYLVRAGVASRITRDHSWVQEQMDAGLLTPEQARKHPSRNVITRALGQGPEIEVDLFPAAATLRLGDWLLLCSDGLHGLVDDDELPGLLQGFAAPEAAERLVKLANDRGAPDNVSVVLAHVLPRISPVVRASARPGPLQRRIRENFPTLAMFAAVLAATVARPAFE